MASHSSHHHSTSGSSHHTTASSNTSSSTAATSAAAAPAGSGGGRVVLTREEEKEFREIFNLVDRDKGGTISQVYTSTQSNAAHPSHCTHYSMTLTPNIKTQPNGNE
jgi:hypothetical protein